MKTPILNQSSSRLAMCAAFLGGAALWCLVMTIQYLVIGSPLTLTHYALPIMGGGMCGLVLLSLWRSILQARNALREHQEEFQTILDSVPAYIFYKDTEGRYLRVNRALAEFRAIPEEQWIGKTATDLFPEDEGRSRQEDLEVMMSRKPLLNLLEYRLTASGPKWSLTNKIPYQDKQGNIRGVIGLSLDVTERKRAEMIQNSLYKISEAANEVHHLDALFPAIHEIVGEFMAARNFYIALYDESTEMLRFPYYVDEYDDPPPPIKIKTGLTVYVLQSERPLLLSSEKFQRLVKQGELEIIGTVPVDWLGVPLRAHEKTIGVLTVQTYTEGTYYRKQDEEILVFVSTQIAMAIERVSAQEALRLSEARLRQIIDLVPQLIFVKNSTGRFLLANQATARLFGTTIENLLQKHYDDFGVSQTDSQRYLNTDQEVLRSGQPQFIPEETFTTPDGEVRILQITKIPYIVSGSEEPAVVGVAIDITEKKRVEDALTKEHNLLRTLIDNLPDHVYVKDAENRFLLANTAMLRLLGGVDIEALRDKTDFDFYPQHLAEHYYADERAVITTGQPLFNQERALKSASGAPERWILTTIVPFRDSQRRIAGIVGIGRDITERKLAEAELQQHNRELALLNHMSDLLQACRTEKDTYSVMLNICKMIFTADSGCLYMMDGVQKDLHWVSSWGTFPMFSESFNPDGCWALQSGKIYVIERGAAWVSCTHQATLPDNMSYVCAPIINAGETLGLLSVCVEHPKAAETPEKWERKLAAKRMIITRVVQHYALSFANLRLRDTLRQESLRDPLTGLYNRRHMEEALDREAYRAVRHNACLGIIMMDIDHFKVFNDTHGHDAGDLVLQEVGAFLRRHIRKEDIACRYGGEEFLVILPDASFAAVKERAEELWQKLGDLEIEYRGTPLRITVSVGLATLPEHGPDVLDVVKSADEALYRAKQAGRNQVMAAPL